MSSNPSQARPTPCRLVMALTLAATLAAPLTGCGGAMLKTTPTCMVDSAQSSKPAAMEVCKLRDGKNSWIANPE